MTALDQVENAEIRLRKEKKKKKDCRKQEEEVG